VLQERSRTGVATRFEVPRPSGQLPLIIENGNFQIDNPDRVPEALRQEARNFVLHLNSRGIKTEQDAEWVVVNELRGRVLP
jgi:hypothetical protein